MWNCALACFTHEIKLWFWKFQDSCSYCSNPAPCGIHQPVISYSEITCSLSLTGIYWYVFSFVTSGSIWKRHENLTAQSLLLSQEKKSLCQGFKDNCTIRNKTLLHGALTALLKLLFYSPKIKWAFLSICPALSCSLSLIPFSVLALWLISEASWECWIMYVPPYRQRHNAISERDSGPCTCWTIRLLLCALFCLKARTSFSFTSAQAPCSPLGLFWRSRRCLVACWLHVLRRMQTVLVHSSHVWNIVFVSWTHMNATTKWRLWFEAWDFL